MTQKGIRKRFLANNLCDLDPILNWEHLQDTGIIPTNQYRGSLVIERKCIRLSTNYSVTLTHDHKINHLKIAGNNPVKFYVY